MDPKGILYLGVALLTFAFIHISDKLGIEAGVDPTVFTFFRIVAGFAFVAIVWLALRKKEKLKLERKHLGKLAILGVLTTGIALSLMVMALEYTTASNKAIMQGMYTACTVLFAYFILHERLPKLFYPTFILIVFGLALLTSEGFIRMPNKGDWLLFSTIPMIGFGNVYAKQIIHYVNPLTVSLGRYLFGLIFLTFLVITVGLDEMATVHKGVIWVICSGALSGIRLIAFYKALKIVGPTLAATGLTIAPAITALSAYFILGETFNPAQIIGLVLMLGGAVLITRMKAEYLKKKEEIETTEASLQP